MDCSNHIRLNTNPGGIRIILLLAGLSLTLSSPAAVDWRPYESKAAAWFESAEAIRIANNILSWQSEAGGWPKNVSTIDQPFSGKREDLRGTFDNGATTGELKYLAQAIGASKDERFRVAFKKGLEHILQAQYPSGGWPQFHPPGNQYHRRITFNDDAMVRLMEFLREVAHSEKYRFLSAEDRLRAAQAFDRGLECILKCQVMLGGKPTVWCAQHDEVDYQPRPGRTYELASLSGAESARVLRFLMSVEPSKPEIRRAVEAGVAWFHSARLTGIRQTVVAGNKRIVSDPSAPPLWARFYEIESNRPIFTGRDGVKKYTLAEIEAERRNGYAWYGSWGDLVFQEYERWRASSKVQNAPEEK